MSTAVSGRTAGVMAIYVLCVVAVAAAFGQTPKKNVAVYMAGKEPAAVKGSYKVLGSELAKTIAKSGAYVATDRTEAGNKIVAQEHIFQRSGAVDDDNIKKLGKQLSVDIVCIAEITEIMKNYYLEARLVDVETAQVFNIVSKISNMADVYDIVRTADAVAHELVTGEPKIVNYSFKEVLLNPDGAIADYTDAIRQKPNVAEYYYNRGVAYNAKKDSEKSISDLTEAIRLNSNYVEAYWYRSIVYYNKGDYDKSIADNTEAIRLKPNYAKAYSVRAYAYYYGKKDYDKAIADYTEAIRLEQDGGFYASRGLAYKEKGDYDKAIADYNEAIRLKPNDAYYNILYRGMAYNKKGDYNKAIADFAEMIRLKPNEDWGYSQRGDVYKEKGDYDKAIADYTKVIQLKPDAYTYRKRGDLYVIKKDYSKAIADYKSVLQIDPNDYFAKKGLEETTEKMKK